MPGIAQVTPAGVNVVPGVVSHFRATVTNAAQALETCTGSAIPQNDGRNPTAVYLGVEPGAGVVYFTWDGVSVPAATLGMALGPVTSPTYIPIAPDIKAGQIKLIASVNPTYTQVKWEWSS